MRAHKKIEYSNNYKHYVNRKLIINKNIQNITRSATFSPTYKAIEEDIFYKKLTKVIDPESKFVANKVIIDKFNKFEKDHIELKQHDKKLKKWREEMKEFHEELKEKKERKNQLQSEKIKELEEKMIEKMKKKQEFEEQYKNSQKEKIKNHKKEKKEHKIFNKELSKKIKNEKSEFIRKNWEDFSTKQKNKFVRK